MTRPEVSVVIAARNAAGTIAQAILSALREPEVVQVLVIDDASHDDTGLAAMAADDASGRLSLHCLETNRGPAAARNLAISLSTAPFISILDADDCYVRGRFQNLFTDLNWDFAADNVMFIDERAGARALDVRPPQFDPRPRYLSFEEFVTGNISRRGAHRGELGFLKPVFRRSFLEAHGLRYDEALRLGEDYELYARAMIHGARFRLSRACGYAATVRANSLSGRHSTEDLRRLADADTAMLGLEGLPQAYRTALRRHERHIRDKFRLRRFLDRKSEAGLAAAFSYALRPRNAWPVARGVVSDKLGGLSRRLAPNATPDSRQAVRFLLPAQPAGQ